MDWIPAFAGMTMEAGLTVEDDLVGHPAPISLNVCPAITPSSSVGMTQTPAGLVSVEIIGPDGRAYERGLQSPDRIRRRMVPILKGNQQSRLVTAERIGKYSIYRLYLSRTKVERLHVECAGT